MNLRNENIDKVFEAILSLENLDECYRFFEDICTIKEIQDIAQRYEVARLLTDKKNYNEITRATGVSSTTITRVNKCLCTATTATKWLWKEQKRIEVA